MRREIFPSVAQNLVLADILDEQCARAGRVGAARSVRNSLSRSLHTLYGDRESVFQTIMQVEANAVRAEAATFMRLMDEDKAARAVLMKFARAFSTQVATTALANGRNKLEERLARWLLMVSDRTG